MAPRRGGFFRGLFSAVSEWWQGEAPETERVPPNEPPSQPPQNPPSGGTGTPDEHETRMQLIYLQIRERAHDSQDLTGYDEWRATYDPLQGIFRYPDSSPEANDRRVERYWRQYLRAFYLTTHEPGHINRRTFYTQSGIPKREIEWELWRQVKRGTP